MPFLFSLSIRLAFACAFAALGVLPTARAAGNASDAVDNNGYSGVNGGTGFGISTLVNGAEGVGFTPNGLTLSFAQGVGNAFSFTITPNGGTATTITGSLAAADISQFQVLDSNAGNGGTNNFFFNSLAVVPEPSATTLATAMAALCLGLVIWPRVRRQA